MDNVPISGLFELQSHLQQLKDDPETPPNAKLLDDVELQLTEDNIPPLLPSLLPLLSDILRSTTQDPTPLLSLTIKLLSPLPFTRCLTIADPPSLVTALSSPLPGANLLALAIIHKAAKTPADAAVLSTLPEVVEELLRRWLETPDVGVGECAARVLGDLLEVDCNVQSSESQQPQPINGIVSNQVVRHRRQPGHARLWNLILQSHSFLSLIITLCSPDPDDTSRQALLQTSLSQGRLLRILPRLATLDLRALTQTPHPDLFPLPDAAAEAVGKALLQWAALGMVDKSDMLMHLSLVDFFETFVSIMRVSARDPDKDDVARALVRAAAQGDPELQSALRSLPNRTVEEEAEDLRRYIAGLLD